MKKFYLLMGTVLTSVFFIGNASAQATYNATSSGTWSSALTWDVNGVPSPTCNNCNININAGVTVTLDRSVLLTGNSKMRIGVNSGAPSSLVINNSGASNTSTGYNISLDAASTSTIELVKPNSTINASSAGVYDGVFVSFGAGFFMQKVVGNAPSYFMNGGPIPFFMVPPAYGKILAGPHTLQPNGTLPVVLVDFKAELSGSVVDLSWGTDVEVNSNLFEVQRSADGLHWSAIGSVAAKGFSSVHVNYSYTDPTPASGVNYYRLRMIDKDGKFSFSPTRIVRGSIAKGITVFPNPATDYINISIGSGAAASLSVRINNQSGQLMQEKQLNRAAGTVVSLPVQGYPEGIYFVQLSDGSSSRQTFRVMISR